MPCDFFLKPCYHVQDAVTVKSLLSSFLSPAQPFAAKGCGRSDRSDIGNKTFEQCFCFRTSSRAFHFPRDLFGKKVPCFSWRFSLCPIKYLLSRLLILFVIILSKRNKGQCRIFVTRQCFIRVFSFAMRQFCLFKRKDSQQIFIY